jgi:hypothetical protein
MMGADTRGHLRARTRATAEHSLAERCRQGGGVCRFTLPAAQVEERAVKKVRFRCAHA